MRANQNRGYLLYPGLLKISIKHATAHHSFQKRIRTMQTRRKILTSIAFAAVLGIVGSAAAQVYPARPVTLIMPLASGGMDTIGRIVAERMQASLGQPISVENIAGASGSIGVGRAVRAAPDGYTLSYGGFVPHVLNGAVYPLSYDLLNGLEPVSLVAAQPLLIVAKKSMPANNLRELIAWLKANPDKALQGTAGAGSAEHVVGASFQRETGTRFGFVPYRGGGQIMQDLIGGQIDILIGVTAISLSQVQAGNVKAYAVTAQRRLAAAPDIPTVDEAGLSGFHVSSWHGIWVPKNTPAHIIAKLNAALVETLADSTVRARLADLGQEVFPREEQTPEALRTFQKNEIEKWSAIIKAANIKAE
jgi:tripartite-type tricarboxylate transporter receptor subunit TctC